MRTCVRPARTLLNQHGLHVAADRKRRHLWSLFPSAFSRFLLLSFIVIFIFIGLLARTRNQKDGGFWWPLRWSLSRHTQYGSWSILASRTITFIDRVSLHLKKSFSFFFQHTRGGGNIRLDTGNMPSSFPVRTQKLGRHLSSSDSTIVKGDGQLNSFPPT